jgi:CRISPR-associated protein Cas5d
MIGVKVEISGTYACFTRPELKVERVSYDVITPSAARGILEAIFWKPAIKYIIDEIAVCLPIKFENIRRDEVGSKASISKPYIEISNDRVQRASMVLRDVSYVVTAHFIPGILGDSDKTADGEFNHGKFADTLRRRLIKGQNYHTPYLGTREFPANVRLIEDMDESPKPIAADKNFGLMLYDIDYEKDGGGNIVKFTPMYFRAEMKQGVIDLRNLEVFK